MAGPKRTSRLLAGSGRGSLLADFTTRLQSAVRSTEEAPPGGVGGWACQMGVALDRGLFSFSRHECLQEPYSDNHPRQVEIKCAQMGNTTRAILWAFWCALFMPFVGILYLFPSSKGSGDFSRSRVGPLIERNPDSLGKYVVDTDSISLKRVRGKNLYFRGTKSVEGLRSDPVDLVIRDESDLMSPEIFAVSKERMGHSDFKWELDLSNPTLPDYGVDRTYKLSDGRRWLLKCPRCGKWTDPIGEWEAGAKPRERVAPDMLCERKDGEVVLLCHHCREGVLHPAQGEWVAQRPGVTDWRGRQYSQLFSQYVTPQEILLDYRTTLNMAAFYNYKLGLAYVEADCRITEEDVLKLCGSHGMASSDPDPNYMGVDQGKGLHLVIGPRNKVIKHIGEYRDFEQLDGLMKAFNIIRCVIDGMPETRKAREFADRFPGRVFLNWYSAHQKGAYAWDEGKKQVSVNRTESLDASHDALSRKVVVLPRQCEAVEEFAKHCSNTAKKLEEDEETGSKVYTWVKLGPDHYRHAFNYFCIAADYSANSVFAGTNLQ